VEYIILIITYGLSFAGTRLFSAKLDENFDMLDWVLGLPISVLCTVLEDTSKFKITVVLPYLCSNHFVRLSLLGQV
jgi:hypothetical protein